MSIRGSCACGSIRFELLNPPAMMAQCHCSRCRKVGASVFVFVRAADFRWLAGKDKVARYVPEPPHSFVRCFCSRCGTALGEPDAAGEHVLIAAASLDDDPGVRIRFHEFVADKPAWVTIADGVPQFAGPPPGR